MSTIISLHPEASERYCLGDKYCFGDDFSPSKVAKQWRSIGYQIRGRISVLLAAKHGKKQLRPGTAEKLRKDILDRCAYLEKAKQGYEDPPEHLTDIIRAFARKEGLFRNRIYNKGDYTPYNPQAIRELMTIGKSPEEIEFIMSFLKLCGIKKETLQSIIIRPIFDKNFTHGPI